MRKPYLELGQPGQQRGLARGYRRQLLLEVEGGGVDLDVVVVGVEGGEGAVGEGGGLGRVGFRHQ